ncbi:MAG: PAS domain S-box protein [Desulfobulbaceae bacterium]|nr:PAS domain S-box protein [Desulfobulbaceae bacterium]
MKKTTGQKKKIKKQGCKPGESEEVLRRDEETVRLVFEATGLGTFDYSPHTGEFNLSAIARSYSGLPSGADQVGYDMFLSGIHPEDRDRVHDLIQDVLLPGSGGEYMAEYRTVNTRDGKECWVAARGRVIYSEQDQPVRFIGSIVDITRRKRAEKALRDSKHFLEKIMESVSNAIYVINIDGRIAELNQAAAKISGYEIGELIGKPLAVLFDENIQPLVQQQFLRVIRNGKNVSNFETEIIRKDGSKGYVLSSSSPLKENGTIIGVVGAVQDITDRRQVEEALQKSMEQFHQMTDAMPQLVWTADPDGNVDYYNRRVKEFEGFRRNPDGSWNWEPVLHPDDQEPTACAWRNALKTGTAYDIEHRVRKVDGTYHWYLSRGEPAKDEKGRVVKWYGTATNIDGLKRIQDALIESKERFRVLADNIAQLAWMADEQGRIFWYNKRWYEYTGTSPEEMKSLGWQNVHHPDHYERVTEKINRSFKTGTSWEDTFPLKGKDGEYRWFLSRAVPIRDEKGKLIRWFGTNTDITERIRLEEEVKHLAQHDALTDLPNRRLFLDIAPLELAQARRDKTRVALFFIDLDRFKEVNDTLGHEAGDDLLQEAAQRLRSGVRESDTVARIGGDEFNILLADLTDAEDSADVAGKILESFRQPFVIAGHHVHVTASIGISIYPDDSEDFDILLKYADIAMYHAKGLGRNLYQFYNPDINFRSIEKITFENMLRRTIEFGELLVHYQPQINIRDGRINCAEALVRWKHPKMGLLSSSLFIPAAEKTGFIISIDEWVLRTACAQFKKWHDEGSVLQCIMVNLSAREFQNPELVSTIAAILEDTGLSSDCLDIEITETMVMRDIEHSGRQLRELTDMGVRISVDNFGTGYSSLSCLKRLPIQRLKIDRSFMKDIKTDPDDRVIVQAVTAMAHSMDLTVVAKGVENEEQHRFVQESKCDEVQGFFYSRPLPAEEFKDLIIMRQA